MVYVFMYNFVCTMVCYLRFDGTCERTLCRSARGCGFALGHGTVPELGVDSVRKIVRRAKGHEACCLRVPAALARRSVGDYRTLLPKESAGRFRQER